MTAIIDPSQQFKLVQNENGSTNLVQTQTYGIKDKKAEDAEIAAESTRVVTRNLTTGETSHEDFIVFDDFNTVTNTKQPVTYANVSKKQELLSAVENATTEDELDAAMKAVQSSYQSTTNNIGKSGYNEAKSLEVARRSALRDAVDGYNGNGGVQEEGEGTSSTETDLTDIGSGSTAGFGNGEGAGLGDGSGNGIGEPAGAPESSLAQGGSTTIGDVHGNAWGSFNEGYGEDDGSNHAAGLDKNTAISDASDYAKMIAGEPQINCIFANNFYNYNALPSWSFSVDFIPSFNADPNYSKFVSVDDMKTLTKAIQTIDAAERTVNKQHLFYLGMSHPFFTKMPQSHGDLKVTFAEDEYFTITTILTKLLRWGSYMPSFPTYEVPIVDSLANAKALAIENSLADVSTDVPMMHAPTDAESPAYRLNAVNIPLNDEGVATDSSYALLAKKNKYLFDIVLKIYRPADAHAFSDDEMFPMFVYQYHKCWLKNVDGIHLDYNDDEPIDRNVVFSYQYLTTCSYDEYAQRYGLPSARKAAETAEEAALEKEAETAKPTETVPSERSYPTNLGYHSTPEGAKAAEQNNANYSNYLAQTASHRGEHLR